MPRYIYFIIAIHTTSPQSDFDFLPVPVLQVITDFAKHSFIMQSTVNSSAVYGLCTNFAY